MVATSQRFKDLFSGAEIVWQERSLKDFGDAPLLQLGPGSHPRELRFGELVTIAGKELRWERLRGAVIPRSRRPKSHPSPASSDD
jgi:hypothetical protein